MVDHHHDTVRNTLLIKRHSERNDVFCLNIPRSIQIGCCFTIPIYYLHIMATLQDTDADVFISNIFKVTLSTNLVVLRKGTNIKQMQYYKLIIDMLYNIIIYIICIIPSTIFQIVGYILYTFLWGFCCFIRNSFKLCSFLTTSAA